MSELYDDFAALATELLQEFGQVITIKRQHPNFDDITNKPTSNSVTTHLTNGCFVNQKDKTINGSRIESGEKLIVIDSTVEPQFNDLIDVNADPDNTEDGAVVGASSSVILGALAGSWTIVDIEVVAPASEPICYFLKVKR